MARSPRLAPFAALLLAALFVPGVGLAAPTPGAFATGTRLPDGTTGAMAALVGVEVHGVADPEHQLEKDLRAALAEQLLLVPSDRVQSALRAGHSLAACDHEASRPACLGRLGAELGARFLVSGRIDGDAGNFSGYLLLEDAATGRTLDSREISCELCGWTELREQLARAAQVLAARAAAEKAPPPPASANAQSQPPPPPLPPPEPRSIVPALEWTAAVAALGLLAAGAVLLAYDGRCAVEIAADAAPGARCPRAYDTGLEGALFLAGGGLAAAGSVALFVVDRRRRHRVAPAVSAVAGGALFSLRGGW